MTVENLSVLFVDDEDLILEAHRRSCRAHANGWDVRFASSAEEALSLITEQPVDVLVSDLAMPGMKGLELVEAVKNSHPATQCIILTGTADMQTAIDAINRVDVFRFYLKPSAFQDIAQGIEDAAAAIKATAMDANDDVGQAALESLPFAVFVTSASGQLRFMNASGTLLIQSKECLTVGHDGVVRTRLSGETGQLLTAISAASARASQETQALYFERESGFRPFHCVVQPFDDGRGGAAMIMITDPERAPNVSPDVLAGLFGLTPSESRLLASLVASGRLEQAADESGLTLSTARTYLKQIFSKTGTGRQGELIQMVLLSPATAKAAVSGPSGSTS